MNTKKKTLDKVLKNSLVVEDKGSYLELDLNDAIAEIQALTAEALKEDDITTALVERGLLAKGEDNG